MNKISDILRRSAQTLASFKEKNDSIVDQEVITMSLDLAKVFDHNDESFLDAIQKFRLKYLYDDISVGSECFYSSTPEWKFIISRIYFIDGKGFFDAIAKNGMVISDGDLSLITKTGNYYPIKIFLGGSSK